MSQLALLNPPFVYRTIDMLGVEDYGSDVESGDESLNTKTTSTNLTAPISQPTSVSSLLSKLPPPATKSTLALPPPRSSAQSSLPLPPPSDSTSTIKTGGSAPPPKSKRTKKIIAINLPLPEDDGDDNPPTKKPRIVPSTSGGIVGAGRSSLLGMLPAPKQSVPVIERKVERVLGGGSGPGLVFHTSKSEAPRYDVARLTNVDGPSLDAYRGAEVEGHTDTAGPSTSFLPPSVKKGKANISLDNEGPSKHSASTSAQARKPAPPPAVDFFSLAPSMPPARSTTTTSFSSSAPAIPSPPYASTSATTSTISSAPSVSTFRPPSPTLDDPCPGYYQLPTGAYAPYEPEYYASYAKKWKAEYDKHIRALEKSQYDPEADGAQDIDMAAEMEKARREVKEREDRKALTAGTAGRNEDGEIPMPRMNVKGAKLGSVARSRHQLTTLLTEAYLNREALEEKIAQGRRNRKEAGNKYGF